MSHVGILDRRPGDTGVGKAQRRDPNSHNTATKSGRPRAHPPQQEILTLCRMWCWDGQAARHAEAPHGSGSGDYDSHKAVGLSWLRLPEPHATAPFESTCGYGAHSAYNSQQSLRPLGLCLPLPLFPFGMGRSRAVCQVTASVLSAFVGLL